MSFATAMTRCYRHGPTPTTSAKLLKQRAAPGPSGRDDTGSELDPKGSGVLVDSVPFDFSWISQIRDQRWRNEGGVAERESGRTFGASGIIVRSISQPFRAGPTFS